MKKHIHFFVVIIITCIAGLISACVSHTKITMVDASVPAAEQSLIVVLKDNSYWTETMLVSINENKLNLPGSLFYIPAGIRTLNFKTTTSSFEDSGYKFYTERTEYVRTTYISSSELQVTDNFLPGHTYRMVIKDASNIKLEDITGSVEWLPPKVSKATAKNGVLTNYAEPRGFYIMPVLNGGPYIQYANVPGKAMKVETYPKYRIESGSTGIRAFSVGGFFQAGPEIGWNKIGLSVLAEINGGVGFGGDTYYSGAFNWGYSFISQLYYYKVLGFGFGYGVNNTVEAMGTYRDDSDYYEMFYNYIRGELLFFPKSIIPLTVYTNYFYDHKKWAFGLSASFVPKREKIFASKTLR